MTSWIYDPTRRFVRRPLFEYDEIEKRCERLLARFYEDTGRRRDVTPSTEDLELIADQVTEEFHPEADLSKIGEDVEGATYFAPPGDPKIRISQRLTNEHRRRMTIAHEIGHVLMHKDLYVAEETLDLFADPSDRGNVYCKRSTMNGVDWFEWQANYAGGAILMPRLAVSEAVQKIRGTRFQEAMHDGEPEAITVVSAIARDFNVSREAARIRLVQCSLIENHASVQRLPL